MQTPNHLLDFLGAATPYAWCQYASQHISTLLIDHAHCERKAALSAIQLITKNPHAEALIDKLSPIVREEMLHFEKVRRLLKKYQIKFQALSPCQYSRSLHMLRSKSGNQQALRDDLIIGAIIEARSCERFFALLPHLEHYPEIQQFYAHLADAEQRHFEIYWQFALQVDAHLEHRLKEFLQLENQMIQSMDTVFRFHSGIPKRE
jgi:tRNA 2-(methylsulfanyl)-N6-isopentenyladenosine37 hydroxylase